MQRIVIMTYRLAPLYCRPWTLNNISPRLIESHYEHNYGAAIERLNAVTEELKLVDLKKTPAPAVSRLKQEQTALLNSTLLHELYFASLARSHGISARSIAGATSSSRWRRRSAGTRDGSY
jgi:Fe-Mn family superoxide dismutase